MSVSTEQLIAATYVAFFERAPDKSGLDFWSAAATASGFNDLELAQDIAAGFANHPSFTAIYGGLSDSDFIDAIYVNVGGQPADANGKQNALDFLAGGGSRSEFVGTFVFGVLNTTEAGLAAEVAAGNITQAEADAALLRTQNLTNQSEVALAFTDALGDGSNLDPGTDPLDPASLANDPAFLASQAILTGVGPADTSMGTALALLADPNTDIDAINTAYNVDVPTSQTFSISTTDTAEGEDAVWTITRSGDATAEATIDYAISFEGTAGADDHGTPVVESDSVPPGTITFAAGETEKTITIPIVADFVTPEDGEGVTITISNATGTADTTSIGTAAATSAIIDNADLFTLTASADNSDLEGEDQTFTLSSKIGPVTEDTTVSFKVVVGDTTAPNIGGDQTNLADFNASTFNPVDVTIKAGESSVDYTVQAIAGDGTELPEAYSVVAMVGDEEFMVASTVLDAPGTQSFTTGQDNLTGAASDDLFIGAIAAGGEPTFTANAIDTVDGGDGEDTLRIISDQNTNNLPQTANVEILEFTDVSDAAKSSLDVTGDSFTTANILSADGAFELTGSSAQDLNFGGKVGGDIDILGGKDVTVDVTGGTNTAVIDVGTGASPVAGEISVTNVGPAAFGGNGTLSAINTRGGTTVTVTQQATSNDTAAKTDATAATHTQGAVTVVGDEATTEVTVVQDATVDPVNFRAAEAGVATTQTITFEGVDEGDFVTLNFQGGNQLIFQAAKDLSAAEVASAFANLAEDSVQGAASAALGVYTDGGNGTDEWTSGAVTDNGATATVTFSIDDEAAAAITTSANASAGGLVVGNDAVSARTGVLGVANGVVTVTDTNSTMTTITVDGYAATSEIDGAPTKLASLTLMNSGGALRNADFTVADTAATLDLTVMKVGSITSLGVINEAEVDFTVAPTTLNVTSMGNNYLNLDADATENLNVKGDGLFYAGAAATLGSLETLTVTEAAGATVVTAEDTLTSVDTSGTTGKTTVNIEGNLATVKGGAGVDVVKVTNSNVAISKDMDLGGGDDTFDMSGVGFDAVPTPTKNILGGDGTDTIKMNSAAAAAVSAGVAFEAKIDGFEKVEVAQTANDAVDTINMDNLDDINYVISNGVDAPFPGVLEQQQFTVTAAVDTAAVQKTNEVQSIDFTGASVIGSGNIRVGGVLVAVDVGAPAAADIVAAIVAEMDGEAIPGLTDFPVLVQAAGDSVTFTFDTRDGTTPSLVVDIPPTGNAVVANIPEASTVDTPFAQNSETIQVAGVNVVLEAGDLDKDGGLVVGSGDDTVEEVALAIEEALDFSGTFSVATDAVGDTVTAVWALPGDKALATSDTAGSTNVAITDPVAALVEGEDSENAGQLFTNLQDDFTVELKGQVQGFGTAEARLTGYNGVTDSTGTADTANLVVNTTALIGTFTVDKIESVDIAATKGGTLTLDADSAETVTITGSGDLTLAMTAATSEVADIDASAATGDVTITTNSGDSGKTDVVGGTGDDTITLRGVNDTASGGEGDDTLVVTGSAASAVTLTGEEGTDSFVVSGFSASNVGAAVTITDFSAGETIAFVSSATTNFKESATVLIDGSTLSEYANEAAKEAFENALGPNGIAWFQLDGNTFLVQNKGADNQFDDGTDIIVQLTGLVDLSTASINDTGAGTLLLPG